MNTAFVNGCGWTPFLYAIFASFSNNLSVAYSEKNYQLHKEFGQGEIADIYFNDFKNTELNEQYLSWWKRWGKNNPWPINPPDWDRAEKIFNSFAKNPESFCNWYNINIRRGLTGGKIIQLSYVPRVLFPN